MTESDVMRDDFVPYGSGWIGENNLYAYMLGGPRGTRVDAHTRLAVMWPSGGGTEVSRVILRADDRSVEAAIYSFDKKIRNLEMRLCRIKSGRYRISIHDDPGRKENLANLFGQQIKTFRDLILFHCPCPDKNFVHEG